MSEFNISPLAATLEIAVPLYALEMRHKGGPDYDDFQQAKPFADSIVEQGDTLLYGGAKGEAAKLFNSLAHAIAVLSFVPGGVRAFGQHWDNEPKLKPGWMRRHERDAKKRERRLKQAELP